MTSYTTTMTSQKIIATLVKAGYGKSDSSTTSVRGWYHVTSGFVVNEDADTEYGYRDRFNRPRQMYVESKTIKGWNVLYTTGSSPMVHCDKAGYDKRAQEYYGTLAAAGIKCEIREGEYGNSVWVPMQPKVVKPNAKAEEAEAAPDNSHEPNLNVARGYVYHKLHRAGYAKDVKVEIVGNTIRISVREGHEFEMYNAHDILARNYIVEYAEHNTVLIISL